MKRDYNCTDKWKNKEIKENHSASTISISSARKILNELMYNFAIENKLVYTYNTKEESKDDINISIFIESYNTKRVIVH